MPHILTFLLVFLLVGLTACEQQTAVESEQQQQTFKYSQETLDKVEQDVSEALEKSKERTDSRLDQMQY